MSRGVISEDHAQLCMRMGIMTMSAGRLSKAGETIGRTATSAHFEELGQPLGVGGGAHDLEAGQEVEVRRLAVARVRARSLCVDDKSATKKIRTK